MPGRSRASVSEIARAILIGSLVGLVVLVSIVAAWRERQDDPIVLTVHPVVDANVIRVYVGGEVAAPGIYALPRGSRVADAIEQAGGAGKSADLSRLGMAAVVSDSDLIVVPARAATPTASATASTERSSALARVPTAVSEAPTQPVTPSATLININQASAEELDALPRIGPVLAQRIVDYRQSNGPFQSVDELAEIRGISDRMVEQFRPLITVGP